MNIYREINELMISEINIDQSICPDDEFTPSREIKYSATVCLDRRIVAVEVAELNEILRSVIAVCKEAPSSDKSKKLLETAKNLLQ